MNRIVNSIYKGSNYAIKTLGRCKSPYNSINTSQRDTININKYNNGNIRYMSCGDEYINITIIDHNDPTEPGPV